MTAASYEPEYLQGIECFNARDFFEAHEVWEDVWKRTTGPDRLFYKGLIHAAVALHHFGNGNLHGARKVFTSCVHYLRPYCPKHLGLDVAQFLGALELCFGELIAAGSPNDQVSLDPEKIPRIPQASL